MKYRILSELLALAVCAVVFAYPTISLAENPGTPANVAQQTGDRDNFKGPLKVPAMTSQLASKSLLNGIAIAGKRIVAVGERGHIIYSDDNGKSWTQSEVPVSVDLAAVYFATPQKGWAVGHDGVVLYSSNAGAKWVVQLDGSRVCEVLKKYYENRPPSGGMDAKAAKKFKEDMQYLVDQGPVFPFLDVWFSNDLTGFVVGANNLIFHTTDGGKNWEPWLDRTENPNGFHFYAIRPVGTDLYMVGEQGLVLKLDPASGRFRSLQTGYNGTFFGVVGKSGSVLVFGLRGNMFRSTDKGKKWQKVESGESGAVLGGTVTADGAIVLVTQSGKVLESKDDGASFSEVKQKEGLGLPACAVVVPDKSTCVIAGVAGIKVATIN